MRGGRLRLRIVIEQDIGSNNHPVGGRSENWQAVLTLRADAAYKGGREYERAKQISADLTTLFVVRFDKRIASTAALHHMRIRSLDNGTIYRILHADDQNHRRRNIHIHAAESQKRVIQN